MKVLNVLVASPEPMDNLFVHLFSQVAHKHGCHEFIKTDGQNVYCSQKCPNCKINVIALEYEQHKMRIVQRTLNEYAKDIVDYNICQQEPREIVLLKAFQS